MSYIVEGKEFKSKRAIADYYGINYGTFIKRLKKWGNLEDAIVAPVSSSNTVKKNYIINGVYFENIIDACNFYGISTGSLYTNMTNNKCSIQDSINLLLLRSSILFKGKTFSNMSELASYYKTNTNTIKNYLKQGYRLEKAIELILKEKEEQAINEKEREEKRKIKKKKKDKTGKLYFRFNGKAYYHIESICEDYNIKSEDVKLEMAKGYPLIEVLRKLTSK